MQPEITKSERDAIQEQLAAIEAIRKERQAREEATLTRLEAASFDLKEQVGALRHLVSLKPLPRSLRLPHFLAHTYGKWRTIYTMSAQERTCSTCGYTQRRLL